MNSISPKSIDVVVPAAGIGSRMGADKPKQYLELNGRTIIEHTLLRLLEVPLVRKVVVVLGAEDPYFSKLRVYNHPSIKTTVGGRERGDSVLNGLRQAESEFVLVHDAARPCVLVEDIINLVVNCSNDNGGILAAPICDTVKKVGSDMSINATIPRSGLYRAFTPQYFRRKLLISAYEKAAMQGVVLTDEASAMENMGLSPFIVKGDSRNIKITEPSDLMLAGFYLNLQHNELKEERR